MALSFLRTLLGRSDGPQRPARVPTDEVLPVFDFDARPQVRDIIMGWTLRFDDILDAQKLNAALTRLLETGDWRKLGGRLRARKDGRLEIHVPAEFTPKRPAVRFSHETVWADQRIAEHALASRLPVRTAARGSVQEGADQFEALAAPDDAPRCLEDFLTRDVAQLGLHVVSFADATLVSLTFPHTMCDLLGLQAIVDNWVRCLAAAGEGEGEEQGLGVVTPLLGAREDPLAEVGRGPAQHPAEEPWALARDMLSGWGWARFVLRMIWDALWLGVSQQHMIYLPAPSLQRLREAAMADLAAASAAAEAPPGGEAVAFLTDNDILTAWLTRMAAHSLPAGSRRTVTFLNFFEIRARLPAVFQRPSSSSSSQGVVGGGGGVYVGNYIFACWAHLSAREAQQAPLGRVARHYRACLAAQTTEGQVRGLLRVFFARTAAGLRVGAMRPDSLLVTCSNWSKAKFFSAVDFSPAVKAAGGGGQAFGPGRPVYYHGLNLRPLGSGRPRQVGAATGVNILGKDAGGAYWITAMLPPKSWPKVREELARL